MPVVAELVVDGKMTDDDDGMLPEYDFTNAKQGAVVCTHGQLKRQCEICGLESQVAFWHDEVNACALKIAALDHDVLTLRAHNAQLMGEVVALEAGREAAEVVIEESKTAITMLEAENAELKAGTNHGTQMMWRAHDLFELVAREDRPANREEFNVFILGARQWMEDA